MHIGTRAIHAGTKTDIASGAIVAPITLSTTFERGYDYTYSRANNPNRELLEQAVASLEGAKHCIAYSSGMAAITSVFSLLNSGERILSISALYGGTAVYLNEIASTLNIAVDYVDSFEGVDLGTLLKPETRMVYVESPTNPTMHMTDIAALATQCRAFNILLAVDNTFSSPIIIRPITLGVDIVLHSATKYLNGHADVILGVLSTNDDELNKTLRFRQNLVGGVPSPFDCWLCQRGMKTLYLRVTHASASALQIARMLEGHESVLSVTYPALKSSKQYALVQKQNTGCLGGGMLAFRVRGGQAGAERVCKATKLFRFAVSLGGVESLIEIPASSMTHRSLPKATRDELGIFEDMIRISVGCEFADDLCEDLRDALDEMLYEYHRGTA